jgi:hypothetical protein
VEWNLLLSVVLGFLMAADASRDVAASPKANSVYVAVFKNQTLQRGLELDLTQALIRAIESRTAYKVVSDRDSAGSELLGTITIASKARLNSNQTVEANKYEMVVTAQVAWRDVDTGEMLLGQRKPGQVARVETAPDNPLSLGDPTDMPPDKALFLAGSVEFCLQHYHEADHYFTQLTELHNDSPLCEKAIELSILSKHIATGDADYDSSKAAEARMLIDKALHKDQKVNPRTDTDRAGSRSTPSGAPYLTFQAKSNYAPELTGSIHSDFTDAVNCLAAQIASTMEKRQ